MPKPSLQMPKRDSRAGNRAGEQPKPHPFGPLPPPRKNRGLLVLTAIMLLGWMIFLAYLAYVSQPPSGWRF